MMLKTFFCGAILLFAVACTDDHFDINDGGGVTASRTIWQNIQAEPQLSDLAAILQRVPVYKSVSDKRSQVLYSTLLDQPQSFTVWAPVNGTFDAQYYQDRLDEAETIADDSLRAVAKFRVGYQFLMNHMARFNYESNSGDQEVFLMNSKRANYNSSASLFNNIPLLAGYESVPSSNGTLHLLNGSSPFYKNMRENIEEDYPSITEVLYSKGGDDTYIYQYNSLNTEASIPGAMNAEGQMVYVDTIWHRSNNLINEVYAPIQNEDSTYVGIVPATEEAYQTVLGKLLKLFKYGSTYWTAWDDESGQYSKTTNGLQLSQEMIDSLAYDRAYKRLFQAMYITPSDCGFDTETAIDSAQLINYILNADTLLTTTDLVYRNPTPGSVNPIFEGKEPRRLSNGYVFELERADFDPSLIWTPRINFSPYGGQNVLKVVNGVDVKGDAVTLTGTNRNPEIGGYIQDDHYQRFQATGNGTLQVFIQLPNVLATSYRVKLVMAPNYTRLSDAKFKSEPVLDPETGEPMIDEETGEPITQEIMEEVISMFDATLFYDTHRMNLTVDAANTIAKATAVNVDQTEAQEFVLFDRVTFNKCYYALPSDDDSAPYLLFEISPRYQKILGKNNNALNIVRIILEPLPDEE